MGQTHHKDITKAERDCDGITVKANEKRLYTRGKSAFARSIKTGHWRTVIKGIGSTAQIFPQPYRVTILRDTEPPLARAARKLSKNAYAIRSEMSDIPTGTDG